MSIAFVTGAGTANGTTSSTISITAPASISSGNLLLAILYSSIAASSPTYTGPSGWTQVASDINPSPAGGNASVWTKAATGSEPGSYSFTGKYVLAGVILQYSGTSGLDGSVGFTPFGSTNSPSAPSQTPSQTGDMLVVAYGIDVGGTCSTPSSMTARNSAVNSGNVGIYSFDELLSSTSATGTISASTSTTGPQIAYSMLLAPGTIAQPTLLPSPRGLIVPQIRASYF